MGKRNKSVEETAADGTVATADGDAAEAGTVTESNGKPAKRIADPRSRSRYWLIVEDFSANMTRVIEEFRSSRKAGEERVKMTRATAGLPLRYRVVRVKPIDPNVWGD